MMLPVRTQAPAETPVPLDEARQHLIVSGFTDDDNQIERFIHAATDHLERTLNMALVTQTWEQAFISFDCLLRLAVSPVTSIKEITYFDADNAKQTIPASSYSVLNYPGGSVISLTYGNSWPATVSRPDAVTIEYTAGVPAAEVPASLKAAILMHVGLMYSYRGDPEGPRIDSHPAYEALIWPFRRPKV